MKNTKEKIKRIVALLGVIILIFMILATLVVAFLHFEGSDTVFKGLLACDIFIPILLWGYLSLYRWASAKDNQSLQANENESDKNK